MQEQVKPNSRASKLPRVKMLEALFIVVALAVIVVLFNEPVQNLFKQKGRRPIRLPSPVARSLRELSSALMLHANDNGRLMPAAHRSPDGRPLLSWRVMLLPYLSESHPLANEALFKSFKLNEPWDSPHNLQLLAKMPEDYSVLEEGEVKPEPGYTYIQVVVGKDTAFEPNKALRIVDEDFPNGLSKTILLVHGGKPVPWTKPEDISYAADQPLPYLGTIRDRGFYAAVADGGIRFIPNDTPEATVRSLMTRTVGVSAKASN